MPDLNQTIECFLQSVRPFIHNSEDDKRIKKLATELASNPSILARQEFLRMLAADTDTNWLSSGGKNDIWIRAAYHSWVDLPLPCNSNVCGWMFLDRPEKGSYPIYYDPRVRKSMSSPDSFVSESLTESSETCHFNNVGPGTVLISSSWLEHSLSANNDDLPTTCLHFIVSGAYK